MKQYIYNIHGISLRLRTDSSVLASVVKMLLSSFERENSDELITLELVFNEVTSPSEIPISVSPSAQSIFSCSQGLYDNSVDSQWKCDFYRLTSVKIIDLHENGLILIDSRNSLVEGYLVEPDARHPELLAKFFYFALNELLKEKGLYGTHAAGLEKEGQGILIPGFSGKGKTTCSISLLRSGYKYISDDHVLLSEKDGDCEIFSFPLRLDNRIFLESFFQDIEKTQDSKITATIDVTLETINFFPELIKNKGYPYQHFDKRFFFVEDIYPNNLISNCKVNHIIFPKIVDYPKSYLEPLSKSKALEALLPQALFVFDPDTVKKQFHFLSQLIEKTDCYQLYFGKNILELPDLIDTLLVNNLS